MDDKTNTETQAKPDITVDQALSAALTLGIATRKVQEELIQRVQKLEAQIGVLVSLTDSNRAELDQLKGRDGLRIEKKAGFDA